MRLIFAFYNSPHCGEATWEHARITPAQFWEVIDLVEEFAVKSRYDEDQNRIDGHICYISDLSKMKAHYRGWDITKSLRLTIDEIVRSWRVRIDAQQ